MPTIILKVIEGVFSKIIIEEVKQGDWAMGVEFLSRSLKARVRASSRGIGGLR